MNAPLPRIASASHQRTNDKAFELVAAALRPGIRVLDLGAGRGHLARRVGQALGERGLPAAGHLLATDLAASWFHATEVPFQEADFNRRLPFADGSFDLIYSIEVIEHLRNPYDFIDECFRLLAPGGTLLLSTPNTLHLASRLRYLFTGFFEIYEPPSIRPENAGRICGHIMPLHAAYYDYALRRSGFAPPVYHVDKEKGLSRWLYHLGRPLLALMRRAGERRVRRYDAAVYQECAAVLAQMGSRTLLTARSLMFTARKPG
ncbi:MAG: methyltransferase domain-containing protein [Burkholderiales bacterium]|jgi:SAM-dependent methyltransferase